MNETGKLLSVIVPSYNMEAYLPKCLNSLVVDDTELLQKLDVIVVNDGSKDRTSEIAHDFEKRYPGVFRVIDKPNGHYGSCINAALPLAKGEYVKVLDADDYLIAESLSTFLVNLKSCDPEVDLVISDYQYVLPNGELRQRCSYDISASGSFSISYCASNALKLDLHSITYRTSIFSKFSYHQTEGVPYTDLEWVAIPAAFARSVKYFPILLTLYLDDRPGQTTDRDIFCRDFHIVMALVLGVVAQAEKLMSCSGKISCQYLRYQVKGLAQMVYMCHFFKPRCHTQISGDLREFDATLKVQSSVTYFELDNVFMPSRLYHFYPIRIYRRWRSLSVIPFAVYKIYTVSLKVFHWILG